MTYLGSALFFAGYLFALAGIVGVLRLPDFYSRIHAVGMSDTLGLILMLAGLGVVEGISFDSLKIGLIFLFMAAANPSAAHAISRAAWRSGLRPYTKGGVDGSATA